MEGRRSGNTLQGPSLHARVRAAHDRRLGQWALTTLVPVHKRECGWGGGGRVWARWYDMHVGHALSRSRSFQC